MRRNVGLALLTIASLYQLKRMKDSKLKKEQSAPVDYERVKRSPIQILKDAEKQNADKVVDSENKADLSTIVYIVGTGKKYHLSKDCRGIKKDSEIIELTLEDAIEKDYSICGWEKED